MTPTQRVQAGLSAVSDKFKQTQGQPGGIRSIAPSARAASYSDPVERMRGKYFDNRQDVSRDRLERRLAQQQENVFNRLTMFKPVQGSSNLLQSRVPGGPSIADVQMQTAMKYGPTPREILGDIGYGFRQVGSALGQKFAAGELGIMGIAKGLYEQFTNNAAKAKDALVKGFDKLTGVEQEVAKDPDKYPKMSSHPRIQGIKDIEEYQMTELDKANLIRENIERVSTPITEKDNTVQSAKVFQGPSLTTYPGQGYLTGAGLPAIANQEDNYIKIQNGQAVPISKEEFLEDQRVVEEDFANDPFFADKMTKTSNQMNIAPGFEIVSDYKSPEARMQELINQNINNQNTMFNSGVMTPKQTEDIFNIDLQ